MSKEDLLEEIEILKGYKLMYHNLSKQNKRYREAIEKARRELETCPRSAYLTLSKALEGGSSDNRT